MNEERLDQLAHVLAKIATAVRVDRNFDRDEVHFTPNNKQYLMTCHPDRKLRVKCLPETNHSMLVCVGDGHDGNSAIVVCHEGELHWYFFGISGQECLRIWSLGWRPNHKSKRVNPTAMQVLKILYL